MAAARSAKAGRLQQGTITLETAAWLAVTSPAWLFLAGWLLHGHHMPQVLDGPDLPGHVPNRLRNGLEVASFLATTGLFAAAAGALWFTTSQIWEARNTRLATIYMEIINRWNAPENVESRRLVLGMARYHADDPGLSSQFASPAEFIDLAISTIRRNSLSEHKRYVAILNFYEDVGGLCWKGYVREDDIFDFMGGQIIVQVELLSSYIDGARNKAAQTNRSTYANTIYLYTKARNYSARQHEEEWPPASYITR